ncbi:uncharacterized protein BJ171DRAFT_486981 [Polychytrium aggregatum]|uniref:uncharacterized protein n=1 Tax=Polychytrium aggregatum TaxID=110093 RepID=UPI0022FDBED5|nr:uncharacterized protein BJ171DRAFT_486981 [Polychytrium aggregatum]KAI9209430.1 hypothetical protein BJ171DRAFT_486981 [Polychytrium aggregatum]
MSAAASSSTDGQKAAQEDPVGPKRLYIGGLTDNNPSIGRELAERFKSFGAVVSVDVPNDNGMGPRDFRYIQINTTSAQLKKCINIYNNSKWKGMKLKVQEAKPTYVQRLKREWEEAAATKPLSNDEVIKVRRKKLKRRPVVYAEDMTLVTDENMRTRKNWRKARYGRAIAIVKLKHDRTKRVSKSRWRDRSERMKIETELCSERCLHRSWIG